MPIEVECEINNLTEGEHRALVPRIMRIVFEIHKDLGRLMSETVYKKAIKLRCEAAGIVPALPEIPITIRHGTFEKTLFMDLLLAHGLMVEAKTVDRFHGSHHAQALQYLFLSDLRYGLLINLRSSSVQKRYVSTTLNRVERQKIEVHPEEWKEVSPTCKRLKQCLLDLLSDWGAFLQTSLYREAMIHHFGGPEVALQKIPVRYRGVTLGEQEVVMISDDTILAMTALKERKHEMQLQLQHFLSSTHIPFMQWINLHNHDVELRTLQSNLA